MKNEIVVSKITKEVEQQLADPQTLNLLVSKVFTGFTPELLKQAVAEGVMRGFEFKDFLEKNVYAIKYGNTYSLVTSIDYARKIGQKSGIVGKDAPTYTETELNGKKVIETCTVTVRKKTGDHVDSYSDTVWFNEFTTGRNLWISKPRKMIAKVAEMSALRMACPEEMAQMYVEEEYQKPEESEEVTTYLEDISAIKTIDELKAYWEKNKGKGKEFAALVTARKKQLMETNANPQN